MVRILWETWDGSDWIEWEAELDVSVTPYRPAKTSGPPEWCHPAEGGDVEVEVVRVRETQPPHQERVMSWEDVIHEWGEYHELSFDKAERELEGQLYDQAVEEERDAAACAAETAWEMRRGW